MKLSLIAATVGGYTMTPPAVSLEMPAEQEI